MSNGMLFVAANAIAGIVAAILVMSRRFHVGTIATITLCALSFACLSVVAWALRGYDYDPYPSTVITMSCVAILSAWRMYRLWRDGS